MDIIYCKYLHKRFQRSNSDGSYNITQTNLLCLQDFVVPDREEIEFPKFQIFTQKMNNMWPDDHLKKYFTL